MHAKPITKDSQRRCYIASVSSISAIGWVSMLLVLSGASAFSYDVRAISRTSGIPNSATAHVESTRRPYRRRTHAQTHTGFLRSKIHATRSINSNRESPVLFSTRLHYRDDDGAQDGVTSATESDKPSWWRGIIAPTRKEDPVDEKQRNVDDYLEFLDRRYNRLHSEEKPESKKAGFSALNWLSDNSPTSEAHTAQQHEDALYVLGVAELASKRLLQKHHIPVSNDPPVEEPAPKPLEIIDATVVDGDVTAVRPEIPVTAKRSAMIVTGAVDAGATVLRRLHARRRLLVRYQKMKLRAAALLLLKAFSRIPKTAADMWRLGGGNKTVAFTASAAFAVFLVVRPLVQAMIYEAAYRG